MDNKHITRDFSAHKQSIVRPYGEYVKLEVFSFDHKYTKTYLAENNTLKKHSNATKTSWKSWSCYKSTDKENDMIFTISYNAKVSGNYKIELIYEQSNHIYKEDEKDKKAKHYNTGKDLLGHIEVINGKKTIYDKNHKFIGENNVLKRIPLFLKLTKGVHTIKVRVPHNCYFMGAIVRKVITFVGDNYYGDSLGSEKGDLMLTTVTFTNSDITKPNELSAEFAYDDALECENSPTGLYIDYMDEVNFYVKDNDNKNQQIFGGYVSSILPDSDRTKLTLHCADRLSDGQNKYVLDQMMMLGGTKKKSEDDYSDSMTMDFVSYPHALKYLCDIHETTLKSNISKDYTVDGEKFHKGVVITFGSKKKVKKIKATNGITKPSKNYIMLRNNYSSEKKQVFTLYDASKVAKKPPNITKYPYLHITYGLGSPKKTYKTKITENVDVAETTAGSMKWTKCGRSSDGKYIMGIGQWSGSKGTSGLSYNQIYKRVFENRCPHCGGQLVWDSGRSDSDCVHCGGYSHSKREWGDIHETEFTCVSCCADYDAITGYEKDSPWLRVKPVTEPVKSTKAEQNKLHNGEMVAVPKTGEAITEDDIFKAITKEAFKYRYVLHGETYQTYADMKKHVKGDCWGFSDLIYTMLSKFGVKCKIVQYDTGYAHRSVLYMNSKGEWVDFPYREYGWGERFDNNLNNTPGSKHGSLIAINKTGSRMGNIKTTSTSTSKKQTTTITNTKGYDNTKPFQGYLKITYSLTPSFKAKKYALYVKFTQNISSQKASINSGLPLYWINNTVKKTSLSTNIVDFLKTSVHKKENIEVYLQSIQMIAPKVTPTKDSKDVNWYKLDRTTNDQSSCKLNLYQIVFNDNKGVEPSDLNSCGKTVNAMMEQLIKEAGYNVYMTYGTHRKDDKINFRVVNQTSESYTATEGDNNNILAWNNISYSPVSSLFNISLQVFKTDGNVYQYIETKDSDSILKYGEQCTLQTSNDVISVSEAYFNAMHSDKLNPNQTYNYTITVPNYPNVKLGDLVKVVANAKKLNNIKEINSIKVTFEHDKMPRIRTELGLGELAPDIQLKKNIRNLRKKAKTESTYFLKSATPVSDDIYYEWDR